MNSQEALDFAKERLSRISYLLEKSDTPCKSFYEKQEEMLMQAVLAMKEQAEKEKEPKPLTLEELKQRDGKPVWVEGETSLGVLGNYWALLMAKGTSRPAALNVKGAYNFSNYGKTWLAYDKEPVSK